MDDKTRILLSQVFRTDSVVYLTKRTKSDAITECVEHLVTTGKLRNTRADKAAKIIIDREKIGTTGIGEGIAVPHAELDFLNTFLGALGISREGIQYNSLDGRPVNYIFLFLTPCERRTEHQAILKDIVTFARQGNWMRFLKNAGTAQEIHDLFREMEAERAQVKVLK